MTIFTLTFIAATGLLWSLGVIVHLLGTIVSLWPEKSTRQNPPKIFWEPISILKPLKGCDSGLEENLSTFLDLDYPSYELLFSVASFEDPAYMVAKKIIERNPQVAAKLIVAPVNLGPNPKVNNMVRAYEQARNDLVLISDSNVRVDKGYLKQISRYMRDKKVGMVTSVISGIHGEGLGGKLEAIFLNSFYARWMKLLFRFGKPCVVGKSMLFRKSTAQRFGGINVLARYLAEDYMAGEAIKKLGLKVVLASEPVPQIIGKLQFKDFWLRHIRWGRIRKSQAFLAFFVEPILLSFNSSFLGCIFWWVLLGCEPFSVFSMQVIIWFLADIPTLVKSGNRLRIQLFGFWLLREFTAFPLWINIALGNTVQWRGERLKLESGGLLADD